MTKRELKEELINFYREDPAHLKGMTKEELQELYDEYNDTSDWHPNESDEEFLEHEDW